ncbi:MAG TPA: DUF1501 domain-containing protein, partial [Urbifossiella sp.]|nr:DUF1501 domain-containing protein [Urbifossiella sp.]
MTLNPTRRDVLSFPAHGLGAAAAITLLARDGVIQAATHHAPKATRAVQITLVGGMSHIDSFDPKPDLTKFHGQPLKSYTRPDVFFDQIGLLRRPDWEFRRRGQSGLWVSELFPHIARHADDLCVVKSMTADSANHTPALFVLNSGFQFNGYPSLGGWLSYGLGTLTEELPAFVVLPDGRGEPNGAASNWTSGFLPAQHQGVAFRGGPVPVGDLTPARPVDPAAERE